MDQATTDKFRYRVVMIWQKETYKLIIVGNIWRFDVPFPFLLPEVVCVMLRDHNVQSQWVWIKAREKAHLKETSQFFTTMDWIACSPFTIQHKGRSLDTRCLDSWYMNLRSSDPVPHKTFIQNKYLWGTYKVGLHEVNCFHKKMVYFTQVLNI